VEQLADLRQRPGRGELGAAAGEDLTVGLHALGAAELGALYRRGELSPLEVARAVIARVEHCEPVLHATWAFDAETALAMARESQARWQRGQPLSALDGVPVTIKENIATKGVPLPLGTAASELVPAAADAPPAARLREAGAVFVAKTTMPDYGMLSSGLSSFHAPLGGPARNPWDPSRTPGGSSAGAGAAAAAGYGPLHLGTDIGGSIRLPAGWCGVFGLKPSNGRVPIQPPYIGRAAGPMTRSVRDAALAMAVLSRPDGRDATSLPYQPLDWNDLQIELRSLKIGLLMDAGWGLPVDPEIAAAVRAAALRFEAAGAIVEPMAPFTTREMADGINLFWRMRSWLDISALPAERQARVLPYIREWVAAAAGFSAAQLFHGYSQMAALRDAAVAACRRFDFVIGPVSPVPAFAAEDASPTNDPLRAMEHIAFTLPYNMSEQPAASIACGHTATGLPIGLQIVGARHDDRGVLRLAHAWEGLRPAPRPWPVL
jgi:aspartyl-tRNA(Asn)/glutamyl-tRNA(Gln) amidotransferase subunit A